MFEPLDYNSSAAYDDAIGTGTNQKTVRRRWQRAKIDASWSGDRLMEAHLRRNQRRADLGKARAVACKTYA